MLRDRYLYALDEVFAGAEGVGTAAEGSREAQAHGALAQLRSVSFAFELPSAQQFHYRTLPAGAHGRDSYCSAAQVGLVFNPRLRHYLFNAAQLDEVFPPVPPRSSPPPPTRRRRGI